MFLAALTFLCSNCSFYDDWEKTQRATPLVNKVLNSQCFSREARDVGLSEYWLSKITTAKRTTPVTFVDEDTQSVGYMYPGYNRIYLNKKFQDHFTLCQTASTLAHETLHLEGFLHAGFAPGARQDQEMFAGWDAAYKVNSAFESCCL